MKIAGVRIDGGEPIELKMESFVKIRVAHAHLFKHVVGICEQCDRISDSNDPEGWSELIESPPLETNIIKRKAAASKLLADVPGCTLGATGETRSGPCSSCQNKQAQQTVSEKMSDLLAAYISKSCEALAWCFNNPNTRGPRVIAYWKIFGRRLRIVGQDPRGIRTVADLNSGKDHLHVISCYRKNRKKDYTSSWMDMCREQSGYRRQGLAVKLEPVQGGEHV